MVARRTVAPVVRVRVSAAALIVQTLKNNKTEVKEK